MKILHNRFNKVLLNVIVRKSIVKCFIGPMFRVNSHSDTLEEYNDWTCFCNKFSYQFKYLSKYKYMMFLIYREKSDKRSDKYWHASLAQSVILRKRKQV